MNESRLTKKEVQNVIRDILQYQSKLNNYKFEVNRFENKTTSDELLDWMTNEIVTSYWTQSLHLATNILKKIVNVEDVKVLYKRNDTIQDIPKEQNPNPFYFISRGYGNNIYFDQIRNLINAKKGENY